MKIHSLIVCFLFLQVACWCSASVSLANTGASKPSQVSNKTDQILKNQEEILKKLEEMKKELTIVKFRCSNN